MISTVKRREIKTAIKCEDFENYTTEFWNLQITPTGIIGRWHIDDRIKNYIAIEDKDPTVYIAVSVSTNLDTKRYFNTNLNICHKQHLYLLF